MLRLVLNAKLLYCFYTTNSLDKVLLSNYYNPHRTCPHWMASSPVLVSSLESPSG